MNPWWCSSPQGHGAPLLTVVVPVRDEAANIGPLVAELRQALDDRFTYELIVVDDGSQDGTWEVLRVLVEDNGGRLSAVRHSRCAGQSMAVLTGAHAGQGTWLVVLDGDGQNDPSDIPSMVENAIGAAARDARVAGIIGCRTLRRDPWTKRVASELARAVRDFLLHDGIPDIGCGLKVVRRDWYLRLPAFDHMHRFIPVLVQAQGGFMLVQPVSHRPRSSGASKYGLWDRLGAGLVDIAGVRWLRKRTPAVEIRETAP